MHTTWTTRFVSLRRLLWIMPLMAACHSTPYIWVQSLPREPPSVPGSVIQPGDLVEVRVFGQDAMSARGVVRADGTLTLPLLGPVSMAGQKPEAVAAALKPRLTPYVNTPQVTVVIVTSQLSVTVVGEVKQPGIMELEPPATVLQALAKAGGLSDFADSSGIYVLRRYGNDTRRIRFRYSALVEAEPLAIGFHLKTGDVLIVE